MERLTHKDCKGWYIHDQSIAYDECRRGKEIDLLAAYENTGRTPEEIVALVEEVNIWKSGYYDLLKTTQQGISVIYESIRKIQGANKQESEG